MPKQTRHSTAYSGVYFVELADEDQSFFIRYKQNGKSFEERAGRSSQGWNAEKASFLRKKRLSGLNPLESCTWNSSGQMDGENDWTFSGIFEAYLRLRPDLKGSENDIYRFRNYIKEDFGDRTPSEVVHDDIERFRHKLQCKKLKPATVRHVLELLRRLANYACKKKFCQGLSFKIQMPTVENQKTENLTQEELERLLRALDDEPDKQVSNIVRLALYTGLRRGEMFNLKWNDIDFYGKTITIRSMKKEKCTAIPMNDMAEKVLAEHALSEAKSEFVFPGRSGKKRTECKRPLLRIKKNAGLPDDFRLLQGLRHVYASMLASSGEVDMTTLQTLLTHKSPLMTQRYAHLREDALKDSDKKIDHENITITQNAFEEKTVANEKENTDQNWELSQGNLAEDNLSLDEMEKSVINNVSLEEDLKENQHEFYSEDILESSELAKSEEIVQAAGQSFEEALTEVAEDEQNNKIADQIDFDDVDERLEENELFEDRLTSNEAEYQDKETEYAEVDADPIKMEVDMDEIVSAEELTETAEEEQYREFKDSSVRYDAGETLQGNEHIEHRLEVNGAVFQEQEKEYTEVDVDPIKLEVDMDEIVSAEELKELTEDHQLDETKAENVDSVFSEELASEIAAFEEDLEVEAEKIVYQDYFVENVASDNSAETVGDLIFLEDLSIETEAEEEISGISEEHGNSLYAGEKSEYKITDEGIEVQTKDEQVIHYNYGENEESNSSEESGEKIDACEGEFSEKDDGSQINDFTAENVDSDYFDSEQQECKEVETVSDDFNQETETVDSILEAEVTTITNKAHESQDDEVRKEDSPDVGDFASEDDTGKEEIDNSKAVQTKGVNNVKIFENMDRINHSEQKSGKNNVFLSKTHQSPEKHYSLKDVKIDLELKTENEASVVNTYSSSSSSISELKKELMSLSELIKSTPAKVQNQ